GGRRRPGARSTGGPEPGRVTARPWAAPGALPRLPLPAGAGADRPPPATEGGPRRPRSGHVPRSPPELGPVPRHHRGRAARLAAAHPRRPDRRPAAPLPRQPVPRRPPRTRAGRGTGPVVAGPRRRAAGQAGVAQQAGLPARTGGAARRRPRPAPGRLPRGADPAPPRGPHLPGGGPADGAD